MRVGSATLRGAMRSRCAICGQFESGGACPRCNGSLERADLLAPPRRGAVGEFLAGVQLAVRGALLTLTTPKLLALVLLPLFIQLAIVAFAIWAVVVYREQLTVRFDTPWITGLDWLRTALAAVAPWVSVLLLSVAALLVTLVASTAINAPFLELLSEKVEDEVFGGGDATRLSAGHVFFVWIWPIAQALVLALIQALLALVFLVLSLSVALAPLAFVGGVWLVAVSGMDTVIARKRYPVSARFRLVRRSLATQLGLALPWAFLPFLLPFSVAGFTLAYLRDRQLGRRE